MQIGESMLSNKIKSGFFKKMMSLALCLIMIILLAFSAMAGNATWRRDYRGWWLQYASGGYPYNAWVQVDGAWYCFDGNGYVIQNNWVKSGGSWYYLGASGAMLSSTWVKSGGSWYYLGGSGAMYTSTWVQSGGKYYYMGSDGAMYVNRQTPDGYYVGSDGAWTSGGSSSSVKSVSTSNIHIIRAVELAKDMEVESYKTPVYILGSVMGGASRINEMLWVANSNKDSRLSESGEYFVMNVDDAKEMVRQIFGSVTSQDVSAMDIYGSNMYYNSVAFRGDAGPHRFSNPSSATIEGSEVKIVGNVTDYQYNRIGTYTVTLSKTDGGYFGGYSFYSLSTSYN